MVFLADVNHSFNVPAADIYEQTQSVVQSPQKDMRDLELQRSWEEPQWKSRLTGTMQPVPLGSGGTESPSDPFFQKMIRGAGMPMSTLRRRHAVHSEHKPVGSQQTMPRVDAGLVIRTQYANQVLSCLQQLHSYAGGIESPVYANKLLSTIRTLRDALPSDPLTELAMAFHNALAFENRWISYTGTQYAGAHSIIRDLIKEGPVSERRAGDAVMKLENLGFDTTPFVAEIDEEE